MRKKHYLSKGVICSSLILVLAASISFNSCKAKEDKPKLKYHLNLGRLSTLTQSPPVILAKEKKYFEKYGLSIDIQSLGNNTSEPLALGKIDACFQGLVKEVVMGANNEKLTFFGGTQTGGVYVGAHKDNAELLKDPANWKGRSVGAILLSTSDLALKDYTTHTLGLEIGEDVFFKQFEDKPSIAIGIGKKNIDLGLVDPEFVSVLEANGGTVIARVTDFIPDNVCCRQMAYTPHFIANREAYIAFMKAQILGYRDFKLDVENSIKILSKAYGEDEDYVVTMVYDPKQNANRGYNPDPNYNAVQGVYRTLIDLGYIDQTNARQLWEYFDISIYSDALKEVTAEYPDEKFFKELREYFISHNNYYPDFEKIYQ